jgi:hypothetical protein
LFKTIALRASSRAWTRKSSGTALCRDQASAMHYERRGGQRPGHHDHVPAGAAARVGLGNTIKYLPGAAGIGLGAMI